MKRVEELKDAKNLEKRGRAANYARLYCRYRYGVRGTYRDNKRFTVQGELSDFGRWLDLNGIPRPDDTTMDHAFSELVLLNILIREDGSKPYHYHFSDAMLENPELLKSIPSISTSEGSEDNLGFGVFKDFPKPRKRGMDPEEEAKEPGIFV